jgi:imidazolonepropionase-like amidohydrolase
MSRLQPKLFGLSGAVASCLLAFAPPAASTTGDRPPVVAFVGVNVVPMDSERLLEKQTVVVERDRIASMGPTDEVLVPKGAQIVRADGQYLMPGLADMHAHLTGPTQPMPPRELLVNYLSEGITTVRLLGGTDEDKQLRDAVARGELVGPTLYTAGKTIVGEPDFLKPERYLYTAKVAGTFLALGLVASLFAWGVRRRQRRPLGRAKWWLVLGNLALAALGAGLVQADVISFKRELERMFHWTTVVNTEGAVRAEVRRRKSDGQDVIKLYDYLGKRLYLAGIDEAKKQGMYVIGHVLDEMPVEEALEGGLNEVAHVDEIMTTHMVGKAHPNGGFNQVTFDFSGIPRSAKAAAEHNAMVVSNLVADEVTYEMLDDPSSYLARPEYAVVAPATLTQWKSEGRAVAWQGQQKWRRETMQPYLKEVVRALHRAGVPLLVGTDVSVEGIVPWHLHRDIQLLVEAGLTPYDALKAATVNAGLSIQRARRGGDFGVVAAGKRADLLLLKENPLKDVAATRHRVGVMARGRWYPQGSLGSGTQALPAATSD